MAKGKKRRKQPMWRKIARAGVRLLGIGLGTTVATSPLHRSLGFLVKGDVQNAGIAAVADTTGMNPLQGQYTIDASKIVGVAVLAGVGVGIASLFAFFSKRI